MPLPADIELQEKLKRWSKYLCWIIIAICVIILSGWQFNIVMFTTMNPATAVCFIITCLSFLQISTPKKNTVFTIIAYAGIIAVVTLCVYKLAAFFTGFNAGFDEILFNGKLIRPGESAPTRMAFSSATSFVLAGITICLLQYETKHKRIPAHYVALLIGLTSLLSLLASLYNAQSFAGVLTYVPMAIPTAINFFLFTLAILFYSPGKGVLKELTTTLSGSITGRILIPVAIIVPAIIGLLRLWGYRAGVYNNEFGVVLHALTIITILVSVIWYHSYSLNKRDLLKNETEKALHNSEEQIRAIFDNAPDSIIVIDQAGVVVKWNPESEKLFGWKAAEVTGKLLNEIIVPEQFKEKHQAGMRRYLQTGQSDIIGKSIDLWAIKKDGTEVDVSLRISPMVLNNEKLFVGFMRDITERKQMENKLKNFNEELVKKVDDRTAELKNIFERIKDGFIAVDTDYRYTYINKKAGELIRLDPSTLIGKNMWELFPEAVGSATYQAFQKAMETQQYVSNTDYFEPLDLWQENHIYPSANGLSIFIRDITESKRKEQQINEARDLADKLIDSLPGVFYFYDANGKFIKWNHQFEVVTGYSGAEIAGMHPIDFFVEEDKEYLAKRIEGVFEKGINDAEAVMQSKTGERLPYYFKAVLITYEGKPCLLGTGIDITEIKKTQEKLKASEQKYKLLFDSNPLPMWMLSLPEYKVIDVNEAALNQYKYDKQEFLKMEMVNLLTKEEIPRMKQQLNTSVRGVYYPGIWQHKKKDDTIIYADIVTHDINYEGKPVRLVLSNDVTEQHLAEEKLKQSYEATRQLAEHIQNIREEERLHIAREIHDELGQLLTVLKMDIAWLNKKVEPASEPVKAKLSDLLALIDTTIKTVRRIASELRPSLLDDLGLVAAMEWHLEEFEKRSEIATSLQLPEKMQELPDALKIGLFRIFQESLTNVARHSGATKVNVCLQQIAEKVNLEITDNGRGFDEKKLVKKTLGLLGMKERTVMMGGEYNIAAAKGGGTSVTVSIPLPELNPENEN